MNLNIQSKKVDVFVVTYNRAAYLEEMIESILIQSFKDFNFIILDNGSTDPTSKVVKNFKDPRISYIKREVNTRDFMNLPFLESKSEYLLIAHDDDTLEPTFLENQIKFLDQDKEVNMVASKINLMDDKGKKLNKIRPRSNGIKKWDKHQFIHSYFLRGDIIPCPSILYRRAFVQKRHLQFEFGVGPAVDLFMLFKSNLYHGKITLSDKALYNYRIHNLQDSSLNKLKLEYQVRPHILKLLRKNTSLKAKYAKASLGFIFHIIIHEFIVNKIKYDVFKQEYQKLVKLGMNANSYSIYWMFFGILRGVKNRIKFL